MALRIAAALVITSAVVGAAPVIAGISKLRGPSSTLAALGLSALAVSVAKLAMSYHASRHHRAPTRS